LKFDLPTNGGFVTFQDLNRAQIRPRTDTSF
jgi:hypothetical protein